MATIGIGIQRVDDLGRQTIEPTPHIDRPAGQVHFRPRGNLDHDASPSAARTRRNAFSLTKASTRT